MKHKFISILLVLTVCLSFAGCGEEKKATVDENGNPIIDTATKELRQNDYRGSVMRTFALKDNVLEVMENMKANNTGIRNDNPNSFWTANGYQDFVSTFLDTPIIEDTQWFNEEETDWETVVNQMSTTANSFTKAKDDGTFVLLSGVGIEHNEKDDYSVTGTTDKLSTDSAASSTVYSGKTNYRILYDCDKDWCKAYTQMEAIADFEKLTSQLFEYARIDNNTFLIQTGRERLMVVLDEITTDTDIRDRTIKEFYYSKLVSEGERTTFEPYVPLPEKDSYTGLVLQENITKNKKMQENPEMNDKGDFCVRYGIHDSLFFISPTEVSRDWVFEDKSLQQAIVYKDGVLIVTTYNKLSTKYERFVYALADTSEENIAELEGIVVINSLVGVQKTTVNSTTVADNTVSIEETTSEKEPLETTENETSTETTASEEVPEETTESLVLEELTDAGDLA